MSNHSNTQGHWETHSQSSTTVKIGDNPAVVSGKEASAQGAFDHGRPVVADSHATSFTNQGHPDRLEVTDESGSHQRSIQ